MTSIDHIGDAKCYRRGCRSDQCRDADRFERKRRELGRIRGIPGRVPGAQVAAHLRRLIDGGHTCRSIANESKVSERAVRYILDGQPTVQRPKALALLAVRPLDIAPRTDATGTIRRIQALAAVGWPVCWTAAQAGHSPGYLFKILRGDVPQVLAGTARRIDALYREYGTQQGPCRHTRVIARRNRWRSLAAWDGTAIDDPAAKPDSDGTEMKPGARELAALRREEIIHLAWCGDSPEQILDRLNHEVSISTVRQTVAEWRSGCKRDRTQSLKEAA
ncbi:hypothetical protein [Streptomyces sp. KN37]|uniref:hypothetical protein n=1 Tax=Streptomyces sp. KN37 TaxID=3090667 RepID=UPI002A76054B|nr:hypothetical protein [Streptomyces sp. KN37]WPO70245.1 hypothetical protein R9806_06180 [Streptomyces sp. KN37]